MFFKIGVLKISQNLQENICWSHVLIKLKLTLFKSNSNTSIFLLWNFVDFLCGVVRYDGRLLVQSLAVKAQIINTKMSS